MKSFILAFTLLMSASSFASIAEINATDDEIRDAVINSLLTHQLVCKRSVAPNKFSGADLKPLIENFYEEDYVLRISKNNEQPLIVFDKTTGDENEIKIVMKVTTNKSLKVVTGLELKIYKKVRVIQVNIGTILEPVYQNVVKLGEASDIYSCEESQYIKY